MKMDELTQTKALLGQASEMRHKEHVVLSEIYQRLLVLFEAIEPKDTAQYGRIMAYLGQAEGLLVKHNLREELYNVLELAQHHLEMLQK
jgi:hypothetical protein